MKFDNEFATLLKKKRRGAGLSMRKLAKKIGVATQTIHNWENGVCTPRVSEIPDIAKKLSSSLMVDEKEVLIAIEKSDFLSKDILPVIMAIATADLKCLTFDQLERILSVIEKLGEKVSQELVKQISRHIQNQS